MWCRLQARRPNLDFRAVEVGGNNTVKLEGRNSFRPAVTAAVPQPDFSRLWRYHSQVAIIFHHLFALHESNIATDNRGGSRCDNDTPHVAALLHDLCSVILLPNADGTH